MTKEKVIDILKGIKDGTACLMPNMPEDGETAIDIAIKAVEQSEPHWILVEHDLPKENYLDDGYVEPSQHVLVYMSYRCYKVSRYWGHRKSKGTSDYEIPDWMDLENYDGDYILA